MATLSEVLDIKGREVSIEDIFTEEYYLQKVQQVYKTQIQAAGISKLDISGKDMLCKRVERALQSIGIVFNKGINS